MSETAAEVPNPHSLQQLVDALEDLCSRNHGTEVSVGAVAQMLGPRSFAPLILAIGLIAVTPIDSIPTLPTTFGVIVFLTAGQMLIGRRSLWLPHVIAKRAVGAERLGQALKWLRPRAVWVDQWVGARLTLLTKGVSLIAIAACCAALAATMPMLELLPLVSTVPALAFVAFGIALLLHDGVAALIGFGLTGATLYFVFELVRLPF